MNSTAETKLADHLNAVYGEKRAQVVYERIIEAITRFKKEASSPLDAFKGEAISEKDVILITYGDFIKHEAQSPLQTLDVFLKKYIKERVSIVHILPFYPYSSDDGFSVIDYQSVNPALGTWEDVRMLAEDYRLMLDAVINHISRESYWFKRFVDGLEKYQDFFITPEDTWNLTNVVRPRTSKLLTEVKTVNGLKKVWTTFSEDQVDLNYTNPEVFVEIVNLLLFYIQQGASVIRLDAIAYLWKESGTTCIHLPQTHRLIKILRLIVDMIAPFVILVTETNVPHEENISYFGVIDENTGETDEAHMVYQFPLAPMVLHTLMVGSTNNINNWIDSLGSTGTFMNFIASHDGIGMLPAIGLIDEGEVEAIIAQVRSHGGLVSHKSNPDGSETVYELNTTLYDALNDPKHPDPHLDIPRFIASQVIMISLAGVPGIYFHSLIGSRNAHNHFQKTGRARSINRKGFTLAELEIILDDPDDIHSQVFDQYMRLLDIRSKEKAFNPRGKQRVVRLSDGMFALERYSPDAASMVLVLLNVTVNACEVNVDLRELGLGENTRFVNLIGGGEFSGQQGLLLMTLEPYQAMWLKMID